MGFSKEKEELSSNERFEERLKNFIEENVPIQARPTFYLFSTLKDELRREPFEELIDGYAFDALEFQQKSIESDEDLLRYSRWVAGSRYKRRCSKRSNYLPTSWFKSTEGPLKPIHLSLLKSAQTDDLNQFPYSIAVNQLLSLASKFQSQSKFAIENLPKSFRPGVRAATEVYLEIGHKLQSFTTLNHPSSFHSNQLHWKGERVYLTKFHRAFIVAREIWGLPTFDSLFN
ncbi:hypothetical protein DFH28DRAFT_1132104 [Melampsora americana]|nr:hypothetical protein DFH28DRAFT_1132104 [Melampsora americana]